MTRAEAEAKIIEAAKQIEAVRREYCPEDDYITLTVTKDAMWVNNRYWQGEHPINCSICRGDDGYED